MKFGCCSFFVATTPDRVGMERVETIARAGYDYVELPMAELAALDDAAFAQYKARLDAIGLPCPRANNFIPPAMRFTGEDTTPVSELKDYCARAFGRANALGIGLIVFGSFWSKRVPEGFSRQKAYAQLVETHRRVGEWAKEAELLIGIEPLRRPMCNIINTYAEGVRLAQDAGASSLRVVLDNYHLDAEREPPEVIFNEPGYLGHVHFSYPNLAGDDRFFPVDESEWDYAPFASAVRRAGYDGCVSVEAPARDFERDASVSLALTKRLFEGEDASA